MKRPSACCFTIYPKPVGWASRSAPVFCAWFAPSPHDLPHPSRRAGLRHTHPTFPFPSRSTRPRRMGVTKCARLFVRGSLLRPTIYPTPQGGRAYATPTLRFRSPHDLPQARRMGVTKCARLLRVVRTFAPRSTPPDLTKTSARQTTTDPSLRSRLIPESRSPADKALRL
jgi:hypothetical protein